MPEHKSKRYPIILSLSEVGLPQVNHIVGTRENIPNSRFRYGFVYKLYSSILFNHEHS